MNSDESSRDAVGVRSLLLVTGGWFYVLSSGLFGRRNSPYVFLTLDVATSAYVLYVCFFVVNAFRIRRVTLYQIYGPLVFASAMALYYVMGVLMYS